MDMPIAKAVTEEAPLDSHSVYNIMTHAGIRIRAYAARLAVSGLLFLLPVKRRVGHGHRVDVIMSANKLTLGLKIGKRIASMNDIGWPGPAPLMHYPSKVSSVRRIETIKTDMPDICTRYRSSAILLLLL